MIIETTVRIEIKYHRIPTSKETEEKNEATEMDKRVKEREGAQFPWAPFVQLDGLTVRF